MLTAFVVFALVGLGTWYLLFMEKKPHIGDESKNYSVSRGLFLIKRLLVLVGISILSAVSAWMALSVNSDLFPTGSKIILAVDVSKSMLTEDAGTTWTKLSRLDEAKKKASEFVKSMGGHPVSLVAFAGETRTLVPFTLDSQMLLDAISALSTESVRAVGSDLPAAAVGTLARFESRDSGAIVFYSDGDDQPADFTTVEPLVKAHPNVRIHAVGIGGSDPAPMPIAKDILGNVRYKQSEGKIIATKLEDDNLRALSRLASGAYVDSEDADNLTGELGIGGWEMNQYHPLLTLLKFAAILTMLGLVIPYRTRQWKKHS